MSTTFTRLHEDTELPKTFNLKQWKKGWMECVEYFKRQGKAFCQDPNWDNYDMLGEAVARLHCSNEMIVHIPLFLGGCSEEVRQKEELYVTAESEHMLTSIKPVVEAFLNSQKDGDRFVRQRAQEELSFWSSFSVLRAQCLQMYHHIQKEELLIFTQLNGLNDYPALKRKTTNKAKEYGHVGHVLNARDSNSEFLMTLQSDEEVRKSLWHELQRNALPQQQVDKLLNLRHRIAKENGNSHYMDHLLRNNAGASPRHIQRLLKRSMSDVAATHNNLSESMALVGAQQLGWTGSAADFQQPWNHSHFVLGAGQTSLALSGKEFPLKRVLNYIVPDLLAVGGWDMVDAKPQRIGCKKKVLYLYRLRKGEDTALLYFAPYPYDSYSDSDNFQAYATLVRERHTGDSQARSPICIVAQNLSLENGAVDDIQQLVFLAHELGHVLHALSFNNHAFETFLRMPHALGELPSVFFEAMATCPTVLQRWTDPKAPASNRRLEYWTRRTRPDKTALLDLMANFENSWIDMEAHCGPARNLRQMRQRMREEVGLSTLRHDDRSIYSSFDFTENAGTSYSYLVGQALRQNILGNNPSENKICNEMRYLLDAVLTHTADLRIAQKWKSAYNKSMAAMLEEGLQQLCAKHSKTAKAYTRALNKKIF